jgi:hypothetical protein
VLRYETNQHYGVHHDYGGEDLALSCGPRILTFFLYLSGTLCCDESSVMNYAELSCVTAARSFVQFSQIVRLNEEHLGRL